MRPRRSTPSRPPESPTPGHHSRRRSGSRRVALAAVAAVGIVAAAAGVSAAEVTAGTSGAQPQSPATHSAGATPSPAPQQGQTQPSPSTQPGARSHPSTQPQPRSRATSCHSLAHIGDSTTVDLISADSLPSRADRLQARYADVGVKHLKLDASGGRSIVETLPSQVNGFNVARAWHQSGFKGCWVFALGTNDAANIAAGSTIDATARIDQMMAVAHGQPVMWVNTRTMLDSGPYSNASERAWDAALVKALHKYPNMRIFNWAAKARPGWFLSDGIHYNTLGCALRARAIADALARAFPSDGHSSSQIVR